MLRENHLLKRILKSQNEVEKYVPIGKIKDTIEPGNEQEYKETEVVSNQIGYNLGKSFVYNGRVGTLIKNADGTYALDTPTEIIDISINGNNKISSEATIEIVGLTPVKIIQRPFTTTTINNPIIIKKKPVYTINSHSSRIG